MTRARALVAILAIALLTLLSACDTGTRDVVPGSPASHPAAGAIVTGPTLPVHQTQIAPPKGREDQIARAKTEVGSLQVRGTAPMTGYQRGCGQGQACSFGPAWTDIAYAPAGLVSNGCGTRDDILARDLVNVTHKGTSHCLVASGDYLEPYSGTWTHFQRGETTSGWLQIDHGRALGDAWRHGASQWPQALRNAYAEDPVHLVTANGVLNEQKGDSTPASWMPPNRGDWCAYAAAYVDVTAKYDRLSGGRFWVGQADKDMLTRALATCPA